MRSLSAASVTSRTPAGGIQARPSPVIAPVTGKPSVPPIPKSMVKKEPTEEGEGPKVLKACAVKGGLGMGVQDGRPPATPQQATPKAVPKPAQHPPAKVASPPPPIMSTSTAPRATPMAPSPSTCKVETTVRPSMSKKVQELRQRPPAPSQAPKPSSMKVENAPVRPSAKLELPRAEDPLPAPSPALSEEAKAPPAPVPASFEVAKAPPAPVPASLEVETAPLPAEVAPAATLVVAAAPPAADTSAKDAQLARTIAAEDSIRTRLEKMDEGEVLKALASAKNHPWFADFEQWRLLEVFGVSDAASAGEGIPEFGEDDADEELVSWELWLWEQGQVRPPVEVAPKRAPKQPEPKPTPATQQVQEQATPVAEPKAPAQRPLLLATNTAPARENHSGHAQEPVDGTGVMPKKQKMQQFGTTLSALNKISYARDCTMSGGGDVPPKPKPAMTPPPLISMPAPKPKAAASASNAPLMSPIQVSAPVSWLCHLIRWFGQGCGRGDIQHTKGASCAIC